MLKTFTTFSPAMMKIFSECPKKFYYQYIQNVSLPQSSAISEKGKKIHALASYYLKNNNIDKLEASLTQEELLVWERLKSNKLFELEVLQTEYTISAKVDECWVGGRLDAFVKDENNYYVLDYKTGAIPKNPEFDYQTMVYLYSVDKLLKGNYDSLTFVYIDLKNNQNVEVKFDLKNKKEYETKLSEICKSINFCINSSYFKENSNKCSCNYINICKEF